MMVLRRLGWLLRRGLFDRVHVGLLLLLLLLRVRVLMLGWVLDLVLGSTMVSRVVSVRPCWLWRRRVKHTLDR